MASGPRCINFEALGKEFQRYISFIEKLREPYKSHIDATLVPFFVYIYLSMLRGKQVDIARKFSSRFSKLFLLIDGFKAHLNDLLQFKTIHEARKHHYFQHFCQGKYNLTIPVRSLNLLKARLEMLHCGTLLLLLGRLVGAKSKNNPNSSRSTAIPPIAIRNEMEPKATTITSSCKKTESISQWISSLRNTDVTNNSEVQNNPNCSQSTAIPPIAIRNEMKPKTTAITSSCKEKESTSQWISSPRNTDVTNNCEDQNISNCSQSTAASSIVIENTTSKMIKKPETTTIASSSKRKGSWIEKPGTSSSLRNTDVKTNIYTVDMLHCIINYGELEVNCADINQENTLIACGFENSTICVGTLDLETIGPEVLFKNKALRKSGHSNDSRIIEHYYTSEFGLNHCLKGHSAMITGLAFAPSGLLMSCSDDTTARAWRMSDFKSISVYRDHGDQIRDIGVSNNGVYFATASIDCTARLWNFKRRTPLINFHHSYEVERLKFDPNCRYLATLSARRIIQLWTVEDGCSMWTIPENDSTYINCITISPDGKYIAYADEKGCIKVWDLSSRQLYSKGTAHRRAIYDLAYNADSSVIVSCAGDRLIRLWDAEKSLLPASKKGDNWEHEKLAKYFAANFNPCYIRFHEKDFILSVNSKLRKESS